MPIISGEDRRRFVRIDVDLNASIQKMIEEDGKFYPSGEVIKIGEIKNLSAGGLQLKSNFKFKINEEIIMFFSIPSADCQFEIKSQVIYCKDIENSAQPEDKIYGIRFLDLHDERQAEILCFVLENQLHKNRKNI